MQFRVEHLEGGEILGNIVGGEFLLSAHGDGRRLAVHIFDHPLETDLLQIEDDVDDTLDDARDGVELMRDTVDPDRGDGETFQRGEQDAAQCVADGDSVSRLEGPELETTKGLARIEHDHLVRFLKC